MNFFIPQKDIHLYKPPFPLKLLAYTAIYSMIFVIVFIDISVWLYQEIYFRINRIPKLKRGKFVSFERGRLVGLTMLQKINCTYCQYANGVILWAKGVANQTEIYSCAIKYKHDLPGLEYQAKFYEQSEFSK